MKRQAEKRGIRKQANRRKIHNSDFNLRADAIHITASVMKHVSVMAAQFACMAGTPDITALLWCLHQLTKRNREQQYKSHQSWRPEMPRRLHFERHWVTWAVLSRRAAEPRPERPRPQHDHSPEPGVWCLRRQRRRCRGRRSFGTSRGGRFVLLNTCCICFMSVKLCNMTAELELFYTTYFSCLANIGQGHATSFPRYCIPRQQSYQKKKAEKKIKLVYSNITKKTPPASLYLVITWKGQNNQWFSSFEIPFDFCGLWLLNQTAL